MSVFTKEKAAIPHRYNINDICIENIELTEDKTMKAIKEIKPNKSQGPDEIHPLFITECKDVIGGILTRLFQRSLEEGKLPYRWKLANVTPIYKTGNKAKAENYRPISVTSICCRIMEENNLINTNQHGFRKKRSCITQLLETIEDWNKKLDDRYEIDVAYMDFKAAFDKVPHKKLLYKVWCTGIRGKIYKWIEDFLTNR